MNTKNLAMLQMIVMVFLIGLSFHPGEAASGHPLSSAASGQDGWVDEFDGTELNPRWSWVREDPALWSLTAQPGALQITANGTLFGDYNSANLLLTPAPVGDFRLVSHLSIAPTENYQAGALLIYQDDDHYIELTRYYNDGNQIVAFNKTWGPEWFGDGITDPATDLYLRIDRRGNEYMGFYSLDNSTWNFIGAQSISFTDPKMGMYASIGPGSQIPVNYYSVALTPIPPIYSRLSDEFTSSTLGDSWSWVREDPDHWSLSAVPGSLRIIAQAGSLYADYDNSQNILLTDAPAGDFRIETKVDFSPTEFLQSAGLIVYQDDNNYLHLSRAFDATQEVEFRIDTTAGFELHMAPFDKTTTYLRIDREGSRYYGSYSDDGINWHSIYSATLNLTGAKVGFAAHGGPSTLNPPADYDDFKLFDTLQPVFLPMIFNGKPVSSGWNVVTSPTQTTLNGIGFVSANNIWAVGANPLNSQPKNSVVLNWDGSSWKSVASPTTTDILSDIDFLTPTDGWLVGTCRIYHWNGSAWQSYASPSCNYINAVDMVTSSDVWAAGYGSILRWNGSAWSIAYTPGDPWLDDIDMVSSSDGWAVSRQGKIYRWNGSAWSEFYSVSYGLFAIQMISENEGWIVGGNGTILRWNGSVWAFYPSPTTKDLLDISMVSSNRGWIVGLTDILTFNGYQWEAQTNPTNLVINAVQAVSDTEAWAVGWDGTILHIQ